LLCFIVFKFEFHIVSFYFVWQLAVVSSHWLRSVINNARVRRETCLGTEGNYYLRL
jgi:hypothetical protein